MLKLETLLAKLAAPSVDHGVEAVAAPRAAVAAILRELPGTDGAELFFIVRAEQEGDPWSGHVAFPGGRREPEDASLLETAMRETREEVGIELGAVDLVARLPDVRAFTRSKRGDLVVTPFVFVVRRPVEVKSNEEVAATLWVPLAQLAAGVGKETFELDYDGKKYTLPYVYLAPQKHRLWGMTYGMLMTLLEAVGVDT